MYRAPEMIDTWSNHEIGTAVDVWALGCICYALCCNRHPFEDSNKLAILNARFSCSQFESSYTDFITIISMQNLFKINVNILIYYFLF